MKGHAWLANLQSLISTFGSFLISMLAKLYLPKAL